jgi:dTDP-glucose pyrophosphorylase
MVRASACLRYAVQPKPEGIAQSFLIGSFRRLALCSVLGDNISTATILRKSAQRTHQTRGARILPIPCKIRSVTV